MSGMGMGPAFRSLRADRSATQQRLARGTVRRVLGYALPHRSLIVLFLVSTVVDAGLVVVSPLLVQRIVDDGILAGNGGLVTWLAVTMAAVALLDGALTVVTGYLSSRIGEGLIYDLRTEVYDHVQRQSIAFFTRAQTGALISRLNNDVIGAQQAFTSTLGGVLGNVISAVIVVVAMFALSWQVTIVSLLLVPLFLLPARWMGRRLQAMTREQMTLNADMGTQMTERFNVAGALLVKLFGRPDEEDRGQQPDQGPEDVELGDAAGAERARHQPADDRPGHTERERPHQVQVLLAGPEPPRQHADHQTDRQ